MRKVEVKAHNGSPAIFLDGRVVPPMMINVWTSAQNHSDVSVDFDYFQNLGKSGIRVYFLSCNIEWAKPGAFELFVKEATLLLDAVEDARIFLRIGLHPSNEWIENNPSECFTLNTGEIPAVKVTTETFSGDMPHQYCLSSSKWREDAGVHLNEFFDKMGKLPFCDRVIGVFFAAGHTSEWYHNIYADAENRYGEFSDAFKRAFSKYLKEKYKTVDALRARWNMPEADFENPLIATGRHRYFAKNVDREIIKDARDADTYGHEKYLKGANIGHFLDVDRYQHVQDFYEAFDSSIAESQVYFARLVKERFNGNMLTGAFFGSYGWTDFFDGGTAMGVLRILDSGYMDFLAAPGNYRNRQPGGFTGQREMPDSFRLRNTIFFVEEDSRTHLEKPFYKKLFDYYDSNDSLNILKRDFGRNLSEDLYAWWLDQHSVDEYGQGNGRYEHTDIFSLFKRQQEIAERAYGKSRVKGNEIAFIYDEESVKLISNESTKTLVPYFRDYEIARLGAGVDHYYHDDMANEKMPDYKLYVFFNTFSLTTGERSAIERKLSKNNAVAVWMYASGIVKPDASRQFDPAHIAELTGFDIQMHQGIFNPKYKLTGENEYTRNMDINRLFGYENAPYHNNIAMGSAQPLHYNFPLFEPGGSGARVLARYADSGLTAVAMRKNDKYTSIFHGSKIINHELLRNIARQAGCHICCQSGDIVYASDHFITIHANSSGKKKLTFKAESSPFEVYEGKYYGRQVKEISFSMRFGHTKTFYLNGEI